MSNRVSEARGIWKWLAECINQIDCEDERDIESSQNPEDKALVASLNGPIKELEKNFGKKSGSSKKGVVVEAVKTNPVQGKQVKKEQSKEADELER